MRYCEINKAVLLIKQTGHLGNWNAVVFVGWLCGISTEIYPFFKQKYSRISCIRSLEGVEIFTMNDDAKN